MSPAAEVIRGDLNSEEEKVMMVNRRALAMTVGLFLMLCLAFVPQAFGATWDEPWHKDVVARADSFGLFEVVSSTPFRTVFKKVRSLAGVDTEDSVQVDGFYDGEPLSTSSINGGFDDELSQRFTVRRSYYLFPKKAPSGNTWRIATPTSGFALLGQDGKVTATFRISMHQAVVDPKIYELTQTCIFQRLHGLEKCLPEVYKYIDDQVSIEPPIMSGNLAASQLERFYLQHAALETAYLAGYPLPREALSKFLTNDAFHVQISGVRALSASSDKDRNQQLMTFVMDRTKAPVARVIAVRMIREVNARELKDRIVAYLPDAPSEETGLGMNIMDPRIGTVFPGSLKEALTELVADWK
jgi:hypothetical protein